MGIDLFIEDGAYTTIAAAVSILLVCTLLFSAATAVWSTSRAGDVQAAADATALAGSNVVSSYYTVATTLDACILSLGLAGLITAGVGLAALLIPGVNSVAAETVDAGIRIIEARNDFAVSASKGLKTLEEALPYLVAVNATRTCSAQSTDTITYTGTALAVPTDSDSEFPALDGETIDTSELESVAEDLDEVADELAEAAEKSAEAKEAAWIADCGRDGMNMQERAAKLSGISSAENPDYASSISWDPNVALDRARAYYLWRAQNDTAEGSDVESLVDAAARKAFYQYAYEQLKDAEYTEEDGTASADVPLLPKNTAEVKLTTLYTDAVWPSTYEDGVLTLHYSTDCPGATGTYAGLLALSAIDEGTASECAICQFSVTDIGATPAASTSISNGFEYHLREFTLALEEYVDARNEELELEAKAQDEAEEAADVFEGALSTLAGKRPKIAPPGRNGCVALVVSGEVESPDELEYFTTSAELGARGAVSASVLAPEEATSSANVLSSFFGGLESASSGSGAVGLIGNVMDLWGSLLYSYGDLSEALGDLMDDLLGGLDSLGGGTVASWLSDAIDGAVSGLGLEAVDLSFRKPVLTDSANVIQNSDFEGLADTQELLRSITLGTTDPAAILDLLAYEVESSVESLEFTVATIELPSGGSIPLTVSLGDLAGLVGGSS